jgi:hypothetical protein
VNTHVFDSIWDILLIFFSYFLPAVDRKQSRELKRGATKAFSSVLFPFGPTAAQYRERELFSFRVESLFFSPSRQFKSPLRGKETNEKEYTLSKVQPSDV